MKNAPGNHDCNGFLKNFASASKIVTVADDAGFCAANQKLGVAFRTCSVATRAKSLAPDSNHGLSEISLGVFVTRSRRSRLS